jgi:hypothetical protein
MMQFRIRSNSIGKKIDYIRCLCSFVAESMQMLLKGCGQLILVHFMFSTIFSFTLMKF